MLSEKPEFYMFWSFEFVISKLFEIWNLGFVISYKCYLLFYTYFFDLKNKCSFTTIITIPYKKSIQILIFHIIFIHSDPNVKSILYIGLLNHSNYHPHASLHFPGFIPSWLDSYFNLHGFIR